MINITAANAAQNRLPSTGLRPNNDAKKPSTNTGVNESPSNANAEIQKLTNAIEKEEGDLKRLNQELAEQLSKGSQDVAKLKSAEIAQKQMQIQTMQLQVSRLENPDQSGEAAGPDIEDAAGSGRARFDMFVKAGGQAEEAPGVYRFEADENGEQKIVFDDPASIKGDKQAKDGSPETIPGSDKAGDAPQNKEKPIKNDREGGMWCTVNTDQVDAEIKQLKEDVRRLEQQLQRASGDDDPEKRKDLEMQLAQANAELSTKDTDSYRKTNAAYTYSAERPLGA